MAWLHTSPRRTGRGPAGGGPLPADDGPGPARMHRMQQAGQPVDLPPRGAAGHLADHLLDLGIVASGPAGAVPLPWAELRAWQQATGVLLSPWEARILRGLSADYVAEIERARDPGAAPPWPAAARAWSITQGRAARSALRRAAAARAQGRDGKPSASRPGQHLAPT